MFLMAESMDGRGGVREARRHVFPKNKSPRLRESFSGGGTFGRGARWSRNTGAKAPILFAIVTRPLKGRASTVDALKGLHLLRLLLLVVAHRRSRAVRREL